MKSLIQLSLKELEPKTLETLILPIKETSIKIHELILDDGIHLIQVLHSGLNTLIDFSESKDCQLLYFEGNKNFIGASYAINKTIGNFLIQTQAKWILIIPFETSLQTDLIHKIEKLKLVS